MVRSLMFLILALGVVWLLINEGAGGKKLISKAVKGLLS